MLVVSTSGAVTALGDTLYPVQTSAEALPDPRSGAEHRVSILAALSRLPSDPGDRHSRLLVLRDQRAQDARHAPACSGGVGLLVVQMGAGVLNILLSAPAWMQVVHLGLATALWITLVVFGAEALSAEKL